ncbi:MAG: phosphoribosylamine--glycine ligase [Ruminococcaceae bacterium]|nr:phosphoribosylamine--glycine ligase [Oscillospiraceae bacterium]
MKILIVGGGGREHAIAWKLAQSPVKPTLYCAPGNGGISEIATLVPIKATDIEGVCNFAEENKIDLVVVAPDDPLVAGMVDALEKKGIRAFGPNAAAAQIEGSKVFAKNLMKKYGIPTASYETFSDPEAAIAYLEKGSFPAVIKAEGLALGKGVIIPQNLDEAKTAVRDIMEDKQFGDAGNRVVIEEFLTGREISVLAFTDGKTLLPMCSAQDHKRALDNDEGLNTGGMGAYSPSPIYDKVLEKECMENIFLPTITAMEKEGCPFKGVLYFGLMSTKDGVKVIEYNARFGDPETQAVLPRMENDLLEIMEAIIDGRLDEIKLSFKTEAAACIIAASGGYPKSYEKGYPISGLDKVDGATVFHSGTAKKDGVFTTNGGRVLGVTAMGETLRAAVDKAYENVKKISFTDMHYRTDIGKHGV